MQRTKSPLLLRILKRPQTLKPALTHKIQKILELSLPLPGMPHDQRRPKHHTRHLAPHPRHKLPSLPPVDATPHHGKHPVSTVLQRNVDVRTNLRILSHHPQHILRKTGRIAVVQTNPLDAVDGRKPLQKLAKATPPIEIKAIVSRILRNDNELPDTLRRQQPRLLHQTLHGHAYVRPADHRNGTVRTAAVASLGNLEVGVVARRGENPAQRVESQHAAPLIHLRNLRRKLLAVTLRQTAEHRDFLNQTLLASLYSLQDGVDRLLLRILDEAAGVDDHLVDPARKHVGILRHKLVAAFLKDAHQVLRVHTVLGAAHRHYLDALHSAFSSAGFSSSSSSSSTNSSDANLRSSSYQPRIFFMCDT